MLARQELIDAAREHLAEWWGPTSFSISSEKIVRAWWGRTRMELAVDVGWHSAVAHLVLDGNTGEVVGFTKAARPGFELDAVGEQTAIDIARTFARREGWVMWEHVRAYRHEGRWHVTPEVVGMRREVVVVCDHSGTVLHPRRESPYRLSAPSRSPRRTLPIRNRAALVLRAKDHCAETYGETPFDIIEERTRDRWWGRREVTFVVDVGFERAVVEYTVNEGNGQVLGRNVRLRDGVELRVLDKSEAVAAAVDYARRMTIPLPVTPDGAMSNGRWYLSSSRKDVRGAASHFVVCATTGVVLERGYITR